MTVSKKEQTANRKLLRVPSIWFLLIGNAIWGLTWIFLAVGYFCRKEADSILIAVFRLVGICCAIALPTVLLSIRASKNAGRELTFKGLCLTAVIAFCLTLLLGGELGWILMVITYFLGHR